MLAIFDYKAGNQTSVHRALEHLGIPNEITNDPDKLNSAAGIIFPGVGAAGQAMDELHSAGLDDVIKSLIWQKNQCSASVSAVRYCSTTAKKMIPRHLKWFPVNAVSSTPLGSTMKISQSGSLTWAGIKSN